MGCAVRPAGRSRVTRQVALRMRYPKPWGEAHHPPNRSFWMGLRPPLKAGPSSATSRKHFQPDHSKPPLQPAVRALQAGPPGLAFQGVTGLPDSQSLPARASPNLRPCRVRRTLVASSHRRIQTGTRLVWTSPASRPKSKPCTRFVWTWNAEAL